VKNTLLLFILVTTQVLGDIWLSRGMKQFGSITFLSPQDLLNLLGFLFTNSWILCGVSTLTFSLLIHLIVISRLDVSYVLPIHAFSYVLNALMACFFLKEQVSEIRWLATSLITIGVFVIIWSERGFTTNFSPRIENLSLESLFRKKSKFLLFLGGPSLTIPKLWLGTLILATADSTGDLLTAIGIKQVGEVSTESPLKLLTWIGKVLRNPFMIGGIFGYAVGFTLFLSLLSWADISLVRPSTAIGYIMSFLGARFILSEQISKFRFVGIVIIGAGVATLSLT
jgi:bacterial/archaeal transporter family protein